MWTAAIVCNVLVSASTGFIILTEGLPRDARYLLLTLLMLLVPLLSLVVLVRERVARQARSAGGDGSPATTPENRAALLCNLVLFGVSAWEAVAQYPYPEGNSMVPFAVLAVGTPMLTLLALLRSGKKVRPEAGRVPAVGT
jgi:hypothetical protein